MGRSGRRSNHLRVVFLSALSAISAPMVFVGIIVLRRVDRRFTSHWRHWTERLQHEIARWT
jgi:hypothetical protein